MLVLAGLRNVLDARRQTRQAPRERDLIANSICACRIATAPRREYVEASVVVLSTPGHEGKAYELSGDVAWSFEEFAATAQELLDSPVRYQALTSAAERDQLLAFGLDEGTAEFMVTLHD